MRKFIRVSVNDRNINIDVLRDPEEMFEFGYGRACGWIESGDLEDLETPARVMATGIGLGDDEEVVEKLVSAFEEILTPPVTVSINGAHWA
jgi:hypothetical protein